MKSFEERLDKVYNVYDHIVSEKSKYDQIIDGFESTIVDLNEERKLIESTCEVLRSLLDKYSTQNIKLLKDLLNKGVSSIFHDRDYSIDLDIYDTKMKKAKLFLVENVNGDTIKSEISNSVGGGIRVVVSFIFRIFLIKVYGKRHFVLLDESFTDVSEEYIPNFMEFMKYLVDKMGFNFLWITHDERIMNYGTRVYQANMGSFKLVYKEDNDD